MTSTWATFTCSLVFLVVTGGVCSIEVVDASGEEAVSHRDDMTPSQPSAASLQSSENLSRAELFKSGTIPRFCLQHLQSTPVPVGSQPRPPESSPVATPLGEANSRQTISTEDVYELVDETEYLHPTHSGWVPVKKPRDTGVGCQQYTLLQRRASRSDGVDGVSEVKDRRTENHAYTHLHQPGDFHNDLQHDSKSAPDVVRLIRRRMNCKSLEPLHAGSAGCTGDTSDSSSSVDTPTSAGYSLQKPVMEVYPRATADITVMAPAADTAYMIPQLTQLSWLPCS
ncbi:uncharacterized protein LOC112570379 [Pomacea canaliculata]|uniref:uncharacterized protein LOC112570379 n=1 Tax=Pomacea canaliculata TaxID=400727 RepID=UPI000D738555|nr:uncharacterized protein LOC112570379 [Pomacea canaliculata]